MAKNTENKTKPEAHSVTDFLNAVENEQQRADAFALLEIMSAATGQQPQMWGANIVGFDTVHYKYDSGREGDMPLIAFSPRKQNLTLYLKLYDETASVFTKTLERLGKHTTGKGCLYIKKLADVDALALRELIDISVERSRHKA